MRNLNRYLPQIRQEQQQLESDNNPNKGEEEEEEEIYSTATVWISGGNRSTLYLPAGLAKKYRMDKGRRLLD